MKFKKLIKNFFLQHFGANCAALPSSTANVLNCDHNFFLSRKSQLGFFSKWIKTNLIFWLNSPFRTSCGLVYFLYACQSATPGGGLSAGLLFRPQPFPHDVLTTSQCFLCFINICMVSNRLLRAEARGQYLLFSSPSAVQFQIPIQSSGEKTCKCLLKWIAGGRDRKCGRTWRMEG